MADAIDHVVAGARDAELAGEWDRALELYTHAMEQAREADRAELLAELQRKIGQVHFRRGYYDVALQAFEDSRRTAEANGLVHQTASALNSLAVVEQFQGHVERAEALYARAAAMADAAAQPRLAALIEQNLGMLANVRGDTDAALAHYGKALERFDAIGDEAAAAGALHNIGISHMHRGELEDARRALERARVLAERAGDLNTLGEVQLSRAGLYIKHHEYGRAREACDRAFEIFGKLESRQALAEAHKLYGIMYRELGHNALADAHLALVTGIARECGDVLLEAEAHHERALVLLGDARNRDALSCLNTAQLLFTRLQARRDLVDVDRRLQRLQETYLQVVRAWGESIESKDRYTAGHCRRVANYACLLAEEVGMDAADVVWFRMGAFLHDVGKTAVPAELLNKPEKLTDDEWVVMQSHTTVGERIVGDLGFPWDIRPLVRHHHEHWDGTGYPDGLKGEDIPLVARILCVADVFDALTTDRSYRPAFPRDEAVAILETEAGRVLDPTLFEAFKRVLERERQTAPA